MSPAIAWAVEAVIASALLIGLVLLVRVPVRRTFGAPVAYALWALPVLRLLLPPLPSEMRDSVAAPLATSFAPLRQVGQQVTIWVDPGTFAPAAADGVAASSYLTAGSTLALLWGLGAAAFLGWHLVSYARFRQRLLAKATLIERIDGIHVVESAAAIGPLAFGIATRYVAFPRDFAARYDADERELALAHELGHHARGDLIANWIALAVLALHWFNPLAWYAFRAFRADQEMANDARVLARLGAGARHAYARAIVKAAHGGGIAAACHLHTVDDLKGRLKMLAINRTSRTRAVAGMTAVATAGLGALALTASGTQAAERVRTQVEDAAAVVATVAPVALPAIQQGGQPVARAAEAPEHVRVVIETDGKRRVYEGAEAAAWIADNPPPVPPAPPIPPLAPVPGTTPVLPVPPLPPVRPIISSDGSTSSVVSTRDGNTRHVYRPTGERDYKAMVPDVREANCGGDADRPTVIRDERDGRRRITICTDRIERSASRATARAAEAEIHAASAQRLAMVSARDGLRMARKAIIANRALSDAQRDRAMRGIDREIARIDEERDDN